MKEWIISNNIRASLKNHLSKFGGLLFRLCFTEASLCIFLP